MTKPAGQEGARTPVRPEPGEAAFTLAPWLKDLPDVPLHPLMVHPVAAMAATTAIGFGMASQFAGLMVGAMQGATARARAALDEAAEALAKAEAGKAPAAPVKAKPALTVVPAEPKADKPAPVRRPRAARPAAGKADDLKAISGIGPEAGTGAERHGLPALCRHRGLDGRGGGEDRSRARPRRADRPRRLGGAGEDAGDGAGLRLRRNRQDWSNSSKSA